MTSCPHSGIEARGGLLSCWEENEEELLRYLISMLAQFLRVQVCPVDLMERERERWSPCGYLRPPPTGPPMGLLEPQLEGDVWGGFLGAVWMEQRNCRMPGQENSGETSSVTVLERAWWENWPQMPPGLESMKPSYYSSSQVTKKLGPPLLPAVILRVQKTVRKLGWKG